MKRFSLLLLAFTMAFVGLSAKVRIVTGIEALKADGFKVLQGKRVGLITNPTGVDNDLRSTIDLLHSAPGVKLTALYSPEHGVRGNQHAGAKIDNEVDITTGVPVYSLYGKNRKPQPELLKDIDVLVYDIQDIGCRSYTYISTMGLAMEACAELGIPFVVLDRPNPLGGEKIEGNLVEDDCVSFVSQFPIPYVYGLTCGELAMMLNGERMLKNGVQCNLTVVRMKKWKRNMLYEDTGLHWIAPSPHIPQPISAIFYPVSGLIGELGYMNIGVGYTIPFQMFAADWIEADRLANALNARKLPGITFRPIYLKPFYSVMKDEQIAGVQVHIDNYKVARLSEIQFIVNEEVARLYPDKAVFKIASDKRFRMFDICCGSKQIRARYTERHLWSDVREYWEKDEAAFRKLSKKYYLYK